MVRARALPGKGRPATFPQYARAAFVSVEGLERNIVESILDKLGHQLVQPGFSTQADCQGDVERAQQQIERALREQSTLLVVDNMESVLLPEFLEKDTPAALSEESRQELQAILGLCQRLLKAGDTRLIFTSREALPAPFDAARQRRELRHLHREDAVKLVERVVNSNQPPPDLNYSMAAEILFLIETLEQQT